MQGIRQNEPHRHHQYLHRQSDVGDERQPPSVPENDLGFLPRLLRCCSHLEIRSFLQKTEAGDFLSGRPPRKRGEASFCDGVQYRRTYGNPIRIYERRIQRILCF